MVKLVRGTELKANECLDTHLVNDFIPKGIVVLAAIPKVGKTFFSLQLSMCLSTGKDFLEYPVSKVSTLYIALEDIQSHVKSRLVNYNREIGCNIYFLFKEENQDKLSLDKVIEEAILKDSDIKLIVIDPYQKLRKEKEIDYDVEYRMMTTLHNLAIKYNLTLLLVMHCRKTFDYSNPFSNIYGSNGITAGVDGMMILTNHAKLHQVKRLYVTGKNIPDFELLLKQEENQWFNVLEYNDVEVDLDINLVRVINYIILKREFIGTHGELCAKCNLLIQPRQLEALIKGNIDILKNSFIEYKKLKRTSRERPMKLKYIGNDKTNDEHDIDDSVSDAIE